MNIGIQTNIWTNERHQDLDGLLAEAAAAGYAGIEIGAHRIDLGRPQDFKNLLEKHGLQLVGLHVHGKLQDSQETAGALDGYRQAAQAAAAMGAPYLMISGKDQEQRKTEAELQAEVEALKQTAAICQEHGLHLLYHNHYWEIEDDLRELNYLLDRIPAGQLSLALDVAWVTRAAHDPVQVIQNLGERVGYLHLKDFRVKEFLTDEWTELGDGYVDLPGVLGAFSGGEQTWVSYERDEALDQAFESARKSRDYLKTLGY